jgi:hypothetical protein
VKLGDTAGAPAISSAVPRMVVRVSTVSNEKLEDELAKESVVVMPVSLRSMLERR